jgi:putative ABC transport system substrate-binding protein
MIGRRDFITLLGGAAAAWPIATRAQQAGMPVIGFVNPNSAASFAGPVAAFKQGLQEIGFVEGRNVAIEYRWGEGRYDRLQGLIADLVARQVTVIAATGGGDTAVIAKSATSTIPIVFNSADDPVAGGLVASLSHPGGNLTGVSRLSVELMPKRLELLREVMPTAVAVAILVNESAKDAEARARRSQEIALSLGWQAKVLKAGTDRDIEVAFANLANLHVGGLLIDSSSVFNSKSGILGALALRHAVPAIYQTREFVTDGGLMSYGASLVNAYHLMGTYAGRILKGEKPPNLPVQQQTKVEFILNLKTAKALGVTIPLPLLGRADEVIE